MSCDNGIELPPQVRYVLQLPLLDIHRNLRLMDPPLPELLLSCVADRMETDLRENGGQRYREEDPDSMHNLATMASRLRRTDLEERILKAALKLAPGNVDLQADLLQVYYMQKNAPEEAERQWQVLNDDEVIDPQGRKRYWRYWVFGAHYHARAKNDCAEARRLLEEGLQCVRGENRSDVLRNFRAVFVDLSSNPDFDAVEQALKRGIASGWELGYTLATELSTLLQQRALAEVSDERGATSHGQTEAKISNREAEAAEPQSEATATVARRETQVRQQSAEGLERDSTARRERYLNRLKEALEWLTFAEATFTNDPNHDIGPIYRNRINILMGTQNYREAIDYIIAYLNLDPQAVERDRSLKAQFILACQRSGERDLWQAILESLPKQASGRPAPPPPPDNGGGGAGPAEKVKRSDRGE
jgi:tetratricopeptide (TPR) repeat protein